MTSIYQPLAPLVASYKRIGAQAGLFPGTTQADFDVAEGTPVGVTRLVGGDYRVDVAGLWRVSAAMLLQGGGGAAHRPRVQLVNNTAGVIEFYQEQVVSLGVDTHGLLIERVCRISAADVMRVFWETDGAVSNLVAPGGIGCTLTFERVGP